MSQPGVVDETVRANGKPMTSSYIGMFEQTANAVLKKSKRVVRWTRLREETKNFTKDGVHFMEDTVKMGTQVGK